MADIWGDVPTWFTALGTCGAVGVALYFSRQDNRRRARQERRRQAELVTAWLGEERAAGTGALQEIIIHNSSSQSVYQLIASLVSVQGAFRDSAVPQKKPQKPARINFQNCVGQIPPGETRTSIASGGHGMNLKFAVEVAFRDATGLFWLRRGDGILLEVSEDPVALYNLMTPIGWQIG